MRLGDHLQVKRSVYYHHGIYIGDGRIIHFAAPPEEGDDDFELMVILGSDSELNTIHETTLERFQKAGEVEVVHYEQDQRYPPLKVVARARSRLSEKGYNLFENNCEHFARWCKSAHHESLQVRRVWDAMDQVAATAREWLEAIPLARLRWGAGDAEAPLADSAGAPGDGTSGPGAAATPDGPLLERDVYAEFREHAEALYFGGSAPLPFGSRFRHQSQMARQALSAAPPGLLFAYRGAWLFGASDRDWFVTERALHWPGGGLILSFHDVAAIGAAEGSLAVTDLDGVRYLLPADFVDAAAVAGFLEAAVSGLPFAPDQMRAISWWSGLRRMLGR